MRIVKNAESSPALSRCVVAVHADCETHRKKRLAPWCFCVLRWPFWASSCSGATGWSARVPLWHGSSASSFGGASFWQCGPAAPSLLAGACGALADFWSSAPALEAFQGTSVLCRQRGPARLRFTLRGALLHGGARACGALADFVLLDTAWATCARWDPGRFGARPAPGRFAAKVG